MADAEYSLSEFDEDDEEEELYSNEEEDESIKGKNAKEEREENKGDFSTRKLDEIEEEEMRNLMFHDDEEDDFQVPSPEIILARLKKENYTFLEFSSSKVNKIKCLALCKIMFGEHNWKTAEAHIQLAETYLKGNYYQQQTLKHANLARDILLLAQNRGDPVPTLELQYLLQNIYLIIGKTNYKLGKYKASENCLQKAKLVSDNAGSATMKSLSFRVSILSALGDSSSKLGNLGQGIEYIEESLEIVHKMPSDYKSLSIKLHKQLVELELMNGEHANIDVAAEEAKKALKISLDINGHDCKDTAEIYTLMSRVESLREISNYEKVEENINKAMQIFKLIDLPEKEILTRKMQCKVFMQQEKLSDAKSALDEAIVKSQSVFGDCSIQTGELFELMGSILFAQRELSSALTFFTKAEDIYSGKRKCNKKREKLIQIIEMIRKSSKDDKLKTSEDKLKERPRFA